MFFKRLHYYNPIPQIASSTERPDTKLYSFDFFSVLIEWIKELTVFEDLSPSLELKHFPLLEVVFERSPAMFQQIWLEKGDSLPN